MQCEEKQIVVGYRDAHTFLKEEFEQNGTLYISTEDGSVGTKGNVMDAIREQSLDADIIFACGPTPNAACDQGLCRKRRKIECYISMGKREWHAVSEPVWHVSARQKEKKMHTVNVKQ